MSPEEYEELKQKYNTENENELRLLQQKELEMLANKNKQASGLPQAVGGAVPPPVVDRKLKPRTSNETNNHNLRTMHVPSDLNEKFLEAVQENTRQNVETCGFLAGKLVPYQKAKPSAASFQFNKFILFTRVTMHLW